MKVALAQINTTVGDLTGNVQRALSAIAAAEANGAELVLLPELTITGYPPLDLLDRPDFYRATARATATLVQSLADRTTTVIFGSVERNPQPGRPALNVAIIAMGGQIIASVSKTLLPTYDVFDEDRWFEPALAPRVVRIGSQRVGVTVCEDLWGEVGTEAARHRASRPLDALAAADFVVNISASPYSAGKPELRRRVMQGAARRAQKPVLHVNLVGANDGLIFDGGSLVFASDGRMAAEGKRFEEDLLLVDTDGLDAISVSQPQVPTAEMGHALVLGLGDYCRKVGMARAVIGLSGGIDSAVTAALAVRALGPESVVGIAMPSEFSSTHSLEDAADLAENLGIPCHVVPIQPGVDALRASLGPLLGDGPLGLVDENLQARVRGQILMAFSNKFGNLVLATGNKSELSVGYCTLYGDMCGALAVIGDVWKTDVYRLAGWLNESGPCVPQRTLDKPPSAELRPDQRDDQSLPAYDVLDPILRAYVEDHVDPVDIAGDRDVIRRLVGLVDGAEYKRRQAPIVLRVSSKAFGFGRRLPVAQGFTRIRATT